MGRVGILSETSISTNTIHTISLVPEKFVCVWHHLVYEHFDATAQAQGNQSMRVARQTGGGVKFGCIGRALGLACVVVRVSCIYAVDSRSCAQCTWLRAR